MKQPQNSSGVENVPGHRSNRPDDNGTMTDNKPSPLDAEEQAEDLELDDDDEFDDDEEEGEGEDGDEQSENE